MRSNQFWRENLNLLDQIPCYLSNFGAKIQVLCFLPKHDFSQNYRPGRRPLHGDLVQDSNCNGIFGVNASSGLTWEEELCGASDSKGIIYIGT